MNFINPESSLNTLRLRDRKNTLQTLSDYTYHTTPIMVHCHLHWDGVWQRPQQFMSRISMSRPVLFVETHVDSSVNTPTYRYAPAEGGGNVTILQVLFPPSVWHDGAYVDRTRRELVAAAVREPALRKFRKPVQWFYDPMAVTAFGGHMNEVLNVYDCMDQLSQFRGAPPCLLERERKLLALADLVFCGGSKLHQDKSRFHRNCHFYGCGVDIQHFAQARDGKCAVPSDIRDLPRPILGYYGVIDERLDYELLAKLAQETSGSVVMVGPLAKVTPDELPSHPKLHFIGRRTYDQLPGYAKAFDVCMMPFALNEATEFINPTKALEYLGAGRPVISTRVPDVVSLFSSEVVLATDHEEFIRHAAQMAQNSDGERRALGLQRAQSYTWDNIVGKLQDHMRHTFEGKRAATKNGRKRLAGKLRHASSVDGKNACQLTVPSV
ncbi:glycosyltransferase family 1 protein [Verrucomicrobia bacterium LW23]|nr:glycosyltransferase family 1 protein [Verrucomicrobia bacterium LW23]